GIMALSEDALEEYELEQWDLQNSSEAAMLTELEDAVDNEEPIVVTLWKPHWAFGPMDLKMLADPKGVYGGDGGHISIVANEELEENSPAADRFINHDTEGYEMREEITPKVFAVAEHATDVARRCI